MKTNIYKKYDATLFDAFTYSGDIVENITFFKTRNGNKICGLINGEYIKIWNEFGETYDNETHKTDLYIVPKTLYALRIANYLVHGAYTSIEELKKANDITQEQIESGYATIYKLEKI